MSEAKVRGPTPDARFSMTFVTSPQCISVVDITSALVSFLNGDLHVGMVAYV
jgi:hypothetical protein